MNLIEEIKLDNGLNLKIFDSSRPIAKDTVRVEILFQTKIVLKESYFAAAPDYHQVKKFMGDELSYEHRLERSFVPTAKEDSTRAELIDTFKRNSLNYIASLSFPQKMALSKLREIKKDPFKYQFRTQNNPEE